MNRPKMSNIYMFNFTATLADHVDVQSQSLTNPEKKCKKTWVLSKNRLKTSNKTNFTHDIAKQSRRIQGPRK